LDLSRRERQIMDAVYRLGRATAAEIAAEMPEPPTLTAVRTMLRILEDKGQLQHDQDGVRHVYFAAVPRDQVRKTALTHLVRTFFNGSAEQTMATLIDLSSSKLSDDELDRLGRLIADARTSRKDT
jgi:BlaI family transcriptional regulator, penicillinase repressor